MFWQVLTTGVSLLNAFNQKKSYDNAADAARKVGEKNAQIIERDIDLLAKQADIINTNHNIFKTRRKIGLESIQGQVRANTAFAGIDIASETTFANLDRNAREYDFEIATADFNNAVTNMQIADAQEDKRLSAELSRMEGGMQAASLRSQGTSSLLSGIGQTARMADQYGWFET
tara:strand:- start:3512 stop:4033 length:522 start_codon:yes stop_codon:yes gene_type:complete